MFVGALTICDVSGCVDDGWASVRLVDSLKCDVAVMHWYVSYYGGVALCGCLICRDRALHPDCENSNAALTH